MRSNKAWLFKEVDSALLGWEVYARKDIFGKETGIALVAGASKSATQDEGAATDVAPVSAMLIWALDAFLSNVNTIGDAVVDFVDSFGAGNKAALAKHLETLPKQYAATWHEGLEATIVALKANEAINERKLVVIPPDLFKID